MHHGHDKNEVRFNRIQDSVRKYSGETAPNVIVDHWPSSRSFENTPDCILYRLDESDRKLEFPFGIPKCRLIVLFERRRVELTSHRWTESRTFRRASSPGTVSTCPVRTSSRLRFASASHSRSIGPNSEALKLSTRRSASRARDSLDSVIASSANCSTVVAIAIP